MTTAWPGNPRAIADSVDESGVYLGRQLWIPTLKDFPSWRTPAEFDQNYAVMAPWWPLGLASLMLLLLAAFVIRTFWVSSTEYGLLKLIIVATLGGAVILMLLGWIGYYFVRDLLVRTRRKEIAASIYANLQKAHVPVWALFVGKIRLGDRQSGPNDTPDDIVFVFDLRAPPALLRRQRVIASAWVDAVANCNKKTNVPKSLGSVFAGHRAVHCAEVFGETMRGVWMWRKGSILPFYLFGLALDDPREAETFTDESVFFTRRAPRVLRHLSRISKI